MKPINTVYCARKMYNILDDNPLHTTSQLDWLDVLVLNLPELIHWLNVNTWLQRLYLDVLRKEQAFSDLWNCYGYFCVTAFTPKQPWHFFGGAWQSVIWLNQAEHN